MNQEQWAKENLDGLINVVIPSFTQDLKGLNEKGIRHDVRKCIELGFTGTLLVSEVVMSLEEYIEFTKIAVDEAAGKLTIVHHASFNTLEDNIEAVQLAEEAGADLVLLHIHQTSIQKTARKSMNILKLSVTLQT